MNSPEASSNFEALIDYLKHNQMCDLTGYKRSMLMRRFERRMQRMNIGSYQSYLQYLQCHPEEHLALLNDVLINFTGFFRDRTTWTYLATEIIPKIIASKEANTSIRLWSAGCSTGQEIYTLLMVFADVLGVEFCLKHIQCYAIDADLNALQYAKRATYSNFQIAEIPPDLLENYFEQTEYGYIFHPGLRRIVTFAQHDLMNDTALPVIDLLVCRNVLMYFTVEGQKAILTRFHNALKNTGFLFVGQDEMLVHHQQLFTPISLKQRIYIKTLNPDLEADPVIIHNSHA